MAVSLTKSTETTRRRAAAQAQALRLRDVLNDDGGYENAFALATGFSLDGGADHFNSDIERSARRARWERRKNMKG